MAVIKYSGLVDQLRGKLNGTVFSRFNAGFNTYKKGQPSRWGSQSQQQKRQLLQTIGQSWKALSQADRNTYIEVAANTPVLNRLGEEVTIPAYQYYVKYGLLFAQTDRSPRPNVITDLQKPSTGFLDLTALEISQQGDRYLIDSLSGQITITTTAATTSYYLVSISSPFANEDLSYQGTYWYVGYLTVSSDIPEFGTLNFDLTDVLMPEGWRPLPDQFYRVRIHPVGYARAQERPPFYKKIHGVLEPPAPPVWAISWSFSSDDTRYTELIPSGGDWIVGATGVWIAATNELLAGSATEYNFEMAISPNLFGSDIARPTEFDVPRPTLSGTLQSKNNSAPYYITPAAIGTIQTFMNTNFAYTSGAGYQYQPVAIRIQRPADNVWSTWGYSNIWLPIF